MKIEPIIYETTRGIYSVEDKLSIASLILFCWKLGSKTFCKLLYTKDYSEFIADLSNEYKDFDIKLDIRLEDKQIKNSLIKTIEKVREKEDKDGYLKALYEGDKFALVIDEIVNYNFDKVELKKFTKSVNEQLTLFSNVL
tara:strand:- start:1107 stop:1526 length:420 start_codon:yes stop_codon:yes gene_type:complete